MEVRKLELGRRVRKGEGEDGMARGKVRNE